MQDPLVVRPGVVIPGGEITWTAVRASGPGGQNVNKVSSKVELRFDLAGTRALDAGTKGRLAVIARGRLDRVGRIIINVDETRDQGRNLSIARERLVALILQALIVPKRRRATRPTRGSVERRLDAKKRSSDKKRTRSSGGDD